MSNHYHLVIETPEANLAQGMRQLNGVHTQWVNRTQGRVGHVFHGRYKPILAEPLMDYRIKYADEPLKGMALAYLTGDYAMKANADEFQDHYTTVNRAIKEYERVCNED